jgi:hypothetical protein
MCFKSNFDFPVILDGKFSSLIHTLSGKRGEDENNTLKQWQDKTNKKNPRRQKNT